jgi:Zn-dependent protease with chaperone function
VEIKANRRRLLVLTGIAALNYWIAASVVTGFVTAYVLFRSEILDHVSGPGWLILLWILLIWSLGIGAVISIRRTRRHIRSVVARTLTALRAHPPEGDVTRIENIIVELAIATGVPPARLAVMDDLAPNALAVGSRPKDTTIVVTTGLVGALTRDELTAVLAVVLCGVANWDVALRSVSYACTSGTESLRENFDGSKAVAILTEPGTRVARAMQRRTVARGDFAADVWAVSITRNPAALRRALIKLRDDPREVGCLTRETASLWFEPHAHDPARRQLLYDAAGRRPLAERVEHLDALTGAGAAR